MTLETVLKAIAEIEMLRGKQEEAEERARRLRNEVWKAEQYLIEAANEYWGLDDSTGRVRKAGVIRRIVKVSASERDARQDA